MEIDIYTDGSCWNMPGNNHGGWSAIILGGGYMRKLSGYLPMPCTNNIAEFTAFYEALASIKDPKQILKVHLYTDSQLLIGYMNGWKRQARLLIDLAKKMDIIASKFNIEYNFVRGHTGNIYNELADELAENARSTKNGVSHLTKLKSVV